VCPVLKGCAGKERKQVNHFLAGKIYMLHDRARFDFFQNLIASVLSHAGPVGLSNNCLLYLRMVITACV
jgi:hypothetical protein